ncbi:pyruvate dehydrogenase complex dihydrolipoamide acetyltransferase, long form [Opitutaceae bacterium TAV1]|nr:pyruvate dehydrogenase complex dihydrolipoamide acetyltransferase, long form [Opitutaceae bacterium TAV1]
MANIIEMPKLSDTMTVGTLVKWLKKEGDTVATGDMLAEVETDKATMELECFFDGTLLKIFSPAGSQVAIGAPLCAVGKPGEKVDAPEAAPAAPAAEAPAEAKPENKSAEPAPAPAAPASPATPAPAPEADAAPASGADDERLRISPLARKLARSKGIDPSAIKGSGPGGRILREDVLAAEKAGAASPAKPAPGKPAASATAQVILGKGPIQEERSVPVSTMRGVIARRLLESKTTIPHFYLDIDIDAEPLLTLRQQLNTALEQSGGSAGSAGSAVKISVNDFILKACAEALRRVPAVNASWTDTGSSVKYHAAAHVSFAVAIDDGLITPVVRDAHDKSVVQIASEAKILGKLAKDKKLKPDQFSGGTFCVSNLGMMGIPRFSPIINPPNAAILGVGTTVRKPVVKNDQIVIGQVLTLTLSCDHRVVDGAVGAKFLGALKEVLENPLLLLV